MQQAVRVEGVPDARPLAEREADLGAALAQDRAGLRELLGRRAVLARDVFGRVLAFGRHRRVELERLEVQLDRDLVAEPLERPVERPQADRAPGAGDVGNEIDLQRLRCHGGESSPRQRSARRRACSRL